MAHNNVSDSFHPDPNLSSFQLPGRREMNIASGCPMFIRLEHISNGGFVKDDCIYVRVVVDVSDLQKNTWVILCILRNSSHGLCANKISIVVTCVILSTYWNCWYTWTL